METTSDAHKSTLRRTADPRPSVAIANPAAAGDREDGEHPNDRNRHIDRVNAREGNGDDERCPQEHVEEDRGPETLGRHREPGCAAVDPELGEEPVAEG